MNLVEVTFTDLLDELAAMRGQDMAQGQVSPADARQMAFALTRAADYCWKAYPWEELCIVTPVLTHADSTLRGGALLALATPFSTSMPMTRAWHGLPDGIPS